MTTRALTAPPAQSWLRRAVDHVREHPFAMDVTLACIVVVASVTVHLLSPHMDHQREDVADPSVLGVALTLAATVPLVWRRSRPVLVLFVVSAAQAALEVLSAVGPGWFGVMIACYSLGAHHTGRHTGWIAGIFIAAATTFMVIGIVTGDAPVAALLSAVIIFPAVIVFGDSMRRRRERLGEMRERAERAERERELIAQQQVQDERTRIARELHDVVAHSLSVMVIQAGAARRKLTANPAEAKEALEAIEATGRGAMDEMRRILGVLRQDGVDQRMPAPSLAMLPDLLDADPDLPVRLRIDGDLSDIPSGVELHAYRVVQEALTNTRRHAGRVDSVTVALSRRNGTLEVDVADDGRGAATLIGARSDGHGLSGMRERVEAAGGRLTAGPRQGGGWRVHAVFPVTAPEP